MMVTAILEKRSTTIWSPFDSCFRCELVAIYGSFPKSVVVHLQNLGDVRRSAIIHREQLSYRYQKMCFTHTASSFKLYDVIPLFHLSLSLSSHHFIIKISMIIKRVGNLQLVITEQNESSSHFHLHFFGFFSVELFNKFSISNGGGAFDFCVSEVTKAQKVASF